MSDEQVAVGEPVLTSGGDQIFPKGLPVGTVTNVAAGKDLFLNIKVKPAADLSKLEEVLVLTEKRERESTAEETGHVRAADILSQRLPSVPDKPAVDPKAAGAAGPKPAGASDAPKTPATAASPKKPSITLDETTASKPKTSNTNPLTTAPATPKPKQAAPATPPADPPPSQTPVQSPDVGTAPQ
jgi:rod shape-determining protein MreC